MAAPMPREAPVIRATRGVSCWAERSGKAVTVDMGGSGSGLEPSVGRSGIEKKPPHLPRLFKQGQQ
ncbi:hypothetical protein GCM10007235_22500 [Pseudoxanthomonas indica]|nr:hypothetical protein GCM10007235_22500 [Pseudoxanthomonas indica]